ncbi:F-box protein At5g39450 [Nicotiana tabacum]|uniref:F-box protein At5g39450 n=3 Tax=Nicotiana TaxID=4085 RepID=A0A1S3YHW4_TOBAC|nr:PREDICTED: F-box protein At5g39450 [Nicotiana sylvestris]XP_009793455.1 PREDICTED: F-box protein At5g39450 [Nicotiana sylvestris]XP_016451532.1 PREDICTED: F-box protein At5g39450-like [Nicotiana tabacum]
MSPDVCGSSLLLALPDDVFAIVSRSLTPRDVCNLGLCCRNLYDLAASDKVWLSQCDMLGVVPRRDLIEWRKGLCSYKALCRFLVGIKPLLGIWVHQNPELGNVVYVMPGFISVVGCRIIPQELGPLGLEEGPILWSPVFEVVSDFEGSAAFFLHGREKGSDYVYPGSLKKVDKTCNALLLEVEPLQQSGGGKLFHSKSFIHPSENEVSRKICRSSSGVSRSERVTGQHATVVPFGRLAFVDRRKLLDTVTNQIRQMLPDANDVILFPRLRAEEAALREDMELLYERRSLLMQMYDGGGLTIWKAGSELPFHPTHIGLSEFRQNLDLISGGPASQTADESRSRCTRRKTIAEYVRHSLKHILKKSDSINGKLDLLKKNSSGHGSKHAQLHEFLQPGDAIGLTLHASTVKLSSYRAWPNMHESRFALYKLPVRASEAGKEYAGLWGGTFGWPPGRPSDDKPGKALFLLLLSYEESQGQKLLIATKILEGTHYVLHPNGSAMFIVNIDEPSNDPFPWSTDVDCNPLDVKHAFAGEGIANGYGFRYPGSKPGSLFVIQDKLLTFIWKESRAVLTLQRLNLQELLRKGERIPALPPVSNFAYLTRSYSNVFAGFSNASNGQA